MLDRQMAEPLHIGTDEPYLYVDTSKLEDRFGSYVDVLTKANILRRKYDRWINSKYTTSEDILADIADIFGWKEKGTRE